MYINSDMRSISCCENGLSTRCNGCTTVICEIVQLSKAHIGDVCCLKEGDTDIARMEFGRVQRATSFNPNVERPSTRCTTWVREWK